MKYYIEVDYNLGDIVYLKTDIDQRTRIVTSIWIRPNNQILYECSQGTQVSNHYGFELSSEVDVLIKAVSD